MRFRRSESGNIFFTLFGAVALIGVIGIATATLMRGPVGTVVNINNRTKVDAQLQIARKLASLAALNQNGGGDCDGDGVVEPEPPDVASAPACATMLTGGGCLPADVGAAKTDPWGTLVGYCGWNHGTSTSGGSCSPLLLQGSSATSGADAYSGKPVIAIISAGPNRVFETKCKLDDGTTSNSYVVTPPGSDDIVEMWTFDEAQSLAGGGLWQISSTNPNDIVTSKDVDITQNSTFASGTTATFQGSAAFGNGSSLNLSSGALFNLPNEVALPTCSSTNAGVLRQDTQGGKPGVDILEICNGTGATPGWVAIGGAGDAIYIDDLADAVSDFKTNGTNLFLGGNGGNLLNGGLQNVTVGVNAGLNVTSGKNNVLLGWNAGHTISTENNNILIGDNIDILSPGTSNELDIGNLLYGNTSLGRIGIGTATPSVALDVNGAFNASGAASVAGLSSSGAANLGSTLNVTGATELSSTLDVQGNVTNSTGTFTIADAASVTGALSVGSTLAVTGDANLNGALNVANNAALNGNLTLAGYAQIAGQVSGASYEVGALNDGIGLFSDAASGLAFRTGASNRVDISSAGDVGIGTTSPQALLDVAGSIKVGQDLSVCAGPMYGAIRYASSNDQLQVCSNTNQWVTVGTSGGGGGGAADFWTQLGDKRLYYTLNDVGIGTNTPSATLDVVGNGLWVQGPYTGTAVTPYTGAGIRMFFDPASAAVRAGQVTGSEWDSGNIGVDSAAFGYNAVASGQYSFAAGDAPTASGFSDIALGTTVQATGINDFALGANTVVSGLHSAAFGLTNVGGASNATVSGTDSFGIFMQDQHLITMTANNTMGLFGGRLVVDPTAPSSLLAPNANTDVDVNGNVGAAEYCDVTGNYCFTAADVASGITGAPGSDRDVLFNSGGSLGAATDFVYTSAGLLGIGVTNPTVALDINGTLLVGNGGEACGAATVGGIRYLNAGDKVQYCAYKAGAYGWTDMASSGSSGASVAAGVQGDIQYNSGGLLGAYVNFFWDAVNRRLGIGTNTPGYPLDVESASSHQAYFGSTGAGNNGNIQIDDAAGGAQASINLTDAGSPEWLIGKQNDNTFFMYDQTHTRDFLRVDATGDLLLAPVAGNVGIGTVTPQALLQIKNSSAANGAGQEVLRLSADFQQGVVGSGPKIEFTNLGNVSGAYIQGYTFGLANVGLAIGTGSNTPAITFGSTGAMLGGASAAAAAAPLDIAGGNGVRFLAYGTGGTPQYLAGFGVNLGQGTNSMGFFTGANSDFTVEQDTTLEAFPYTSYTTRLDIKPGGDVGIGTVTPYTLLDVAGTVKVANGGEVCGSHIAGGIRYLGGDLQYCDGAQWNTISSNGTGGVAAAGVTGSVQFNSGGVLAGDGASFYWDDVNKRMGIGTNAPLAGLDVQNPITAAAGVGYGTRLAQALTTHANNDALYGLYISPTYTNTGGYTYTSADIGFGGGMGRIIAVDNNGAGTGSSLTLRAGGTSGGTNVAGGNLILSAGQASGSGNSMISFLGAGYGTSGTGSDVPAEIGRITGGGVVQFTGAFGGGDTMLSATGTATPGAGTRMLWYPNKAAFRAGYVNSNQWDDSYIGIGSIVLGTESVASGAVSVALGDTNQALGTGSTVLGRGAISSGTQSVALGSYVNASGNYSAALGLTGINSSSYATVSGTDSFGIFMQDQHNDVITANNVMALEGGQLLVDPTSSAGATISTVYTALQVNGSIKIANGGETCGSNYAGAIRYLSASIQYCDGANWQTVASSGSGGVTAAGSNTQVQFNSGGVLGASANFTWNGTALTATNQNIPATGAYEIAGTAVFDYPFAGADTTGLAIGANALSGQTAATLYNVAVGANAGQYISTSKENVAIGYDALQGVSAAPLTGSFNTAIGYYVLANVQSSASANVGVGAAALSNLTTGTDNTAIGVAALSQASVTNNATAIGVQALGNTTATNSALGYLAGYNISTGSGNTAIGTYAMEASSSTKLTGSYNTAVGDSALYGIQGAAGSNTAEGYKAGGVTTGSNNTTIGYQAGATVLTAVNNTLVGYEAGEAVTGNGNIMLGEDPSSTITSGSNNIIIGNSLGNVTNTSNAQLDIGDVITGTTGGSGKIGIALGTANPPTTALDVNGTVQIANGNEACGSTYAGAIRYLSATIQYCDGSNWQTVSSSGSGGVTAAGLTGDIQFNSAGTLGADTTSFFWDKTNKRLGLGTTSPLAELNLNSGGTQNNDALLIGNNSTKGLQLRDTGSALDIETFGSGGTLNINNNISQTTQIGPTNTLTVTGTAFVGIGTATPLAALDAQNSVTAASNLAYGTRLKQTLTTAANGDTLYGLFINPTYTNTGGYTYTSVDLGFGGGQSRLIQVANNGTGTGSSLTVQAGATVGGTNVNGGNLILSGGQSSGNGNSEIQFYGAPAGSSGTGNNPPAQVGLISGGGFVQFSSAGLGDTMAQATGTATPGAGTRMVWYPAKAAFRAGGVSGTQWNDANIGQYSAATGISSIASGYASFAAGSLAVASNQQSIALGNTVTASGANSIGLGSSINASGANSIALGQYATASGINSIAIGLIPTYAANLPVASGTGTFGIFMQDQHNEVISANNVMALEGGQLLVDPTSGAQATVANVYTALQVNGSIKIANGGETCGSNYAGAIRYIAATIQYCDGANWDTVSSSGSGGVTAAGLTGDVQFNSGGTLGADTANFFWDNANKRLGIGTVTPASSIDVGGGTVRATVFSGYYMLGQSDLYYTKLSGGNTNKGGEIDLYGGTNGASPGIIAFLTGTSGTSPEVARIDASGRFGIGTTSPLAALDVATGITAASNVAYGTRLQQTLTPAATGDVLYGLYINPTYNNSYPNVPIDIGFGGAANRVIQVANNGTSAGSSLSLAAGATFGGTNVNGGDLYLKSGQSSGTGTSKIYFYGAGYGTSGTGSNAPAEVGRVTGGGFVQFTGTYGSGDTMLAATGTATPGAGTRMVWYPRAGAFRAGTAMGTEWDDANIGADSAAFGIGSQASNTGSFAAGNYAISSNLYTMALGNGVKASASGAVALGSHAVASGPQSAALGLTSISTSTLPTVSGTDSFGIFMQDQHNELISASNVMALEGGQMLVDPTSGAGATVSSVYTALQVNGSMKIGNGAEACGSNYAGAIRYYAATLQYCDGGTWDTISSSGGGGVTAAGSSGDVQFNSGGTLSADDSNFWWDRTNNRLGIGTNSPAYQIQVSQGSSTTTSPSVIGFTATGAGNASRFALDQNDGIQVAANDRMQLSSYWGMEIHGYSKTGFPSFTAGSSEPSLTVFGTSGDANPILNLVNNAGTTTEVTFSSGGNMLTNGYARIGSTTAPANTTAGDLTATRLSVGNTGFSTSAGEFLNATGTMTDTANIGASGFNFTATVNPASASAAQFRSLAMSSQVSGSQSLAGTGASDGGYFESRLIGSNSVGTMRGIEAVGMVQGSAGVNFGTITSVVGGQFTALSSFGNTATGTVSNATGVLVPSSGTNGTLTFTSQAGVDIAQQINATNNTLLLMGTTTIPSGNFGIYDSSSYTNYLGAKTGIGTTNPYTELEVAGTVKVGNGAETCGTNYAGAIRYYNATLQYCDTSNWNTISSSGSGGVTAAGNTGDIQFNSGGTLGADTANFFWDNTNKRLSIGTITPSAALHVLATSQQLRLGYDATHYISDTVGSTGALTEALQANITNAFQLTDGTSTYETVDTRTTNSGSSAFTFNAPAPTIASSATATYTTGTFSAPTITLIGGTAVTSLMKSYRYAPPTITDATADAISTAANLDVYGPPIQAGSVTLNNTYGLYIESGASVAGATNAYGLAVAVPTGATNNYAANFGGKVGINTASPYTMLEVAGTVKVGNGAETCGTNYAGALRYYNATLQYCDTSNWNTISSSGSGGVTAAGSTGSVQFNSGGTLGADNTNFWWDNTNKRLGIGTNTPADKFDIVQNINADAQLNITNAYSGKGAYLTASAGSNYLGLTLYGTGAAWSIGEGGTTSFRVNDSTNSTNPFIIEPATPTNALYEKANGAIGLMTNAPLAGLDVQTSVTAASNLAYGTRLKQTLTTAANGDTLYGLFINPTYTNTGGYTYTSVDLGFGGGQSRLIQVANNGTGTGSSLTVQAGATVGGTNVNGGNLILSGGQSSGNGGSNILFQTSGGGSSGISASASKTVWTMDAFGNFYNSGSSLYLGNDSNVGQNAFTALGATYITSGIGGATAYNIYLKPSSTGKVGVGTVTPYTMLDVAGTIKVANGNETCGSNYAGAIRYYSATIQYCDGGTWDTLSSSGSGGVSAAGNTGDVQFNSGGTLGADTANFFWDNTNKRLGIGTITPATRVDIASGAYGIGGQAVLALPDADTSSVAVGVQALSTQNQTGLDNVAVGYQTLNSIGSSGGSQNVAVGYQAGNAINSGCCNVAIGTNALTKATSGASNVAIGHWAGYNTNGNNNVYLGANAGFNDTGSNDFFINNVQESNLANDKAYSLLYGTFSGTAGSLTGQQLTINGLVGINTSAPLAGLDVQNSVTAASNIAYGTRLAQTLKTAANGDALYGLYINPTYTNTGGFTYSSADIAFGGGQSRTIMVANNGTGVGSSLSIAAGATVGGTNVAGGNLIVSSGQSSGNAGSYIYFGTATPGVSGSGANLPAVAWTMDPYGNLIGANSLEIGYDTTVSHSAFSTLNSDTYITSGYGNGNSAAFNIIIKPSSTGKVGIGTTSPYTKLEVAGTIKVANGNETCGSNYAGGIRYIAATLQYCDGANWDTISSSGSGGSAAAGSTGSIQFNSGGLLGADNTNFWWDNTNKRMGIGTNSPAAELNLNSGGTENNDTLLIGNTSTKGLQLRDTGSALDIESFGAGGTLNINNNSSQTTVLGPLNTLTVTGTALVGVGTTTPVAGVDVQNSVTAASGVAFGARLQQTIKASANNDSLVGLYIGPGYNDNGKSNVGHSDVLFDGGANRTLGVGSAAPGVAGKNLTVNAGYAVSGTDVNGGNLILAAGSGTGTGNSMIQFYGSGYGTSGTNANSEAEIGRITGGGFVQFVGTASTGDTMLAATGTATPGAGARMVWYPDKTAFRAGNPNGTAWDDANIGSKSVAFDSGLASGTDSTAWGNSNSATNTGATAFGQGSTASGTTSIAMGGSVTASGNGSLAMGAYAKASGTNSAVLGLTSIATATNATVSGTDSFGIFMQDQHNEVISANNVMALEGGQMLVDPTSGAQATVASVYTALQVNGSIKVGNGAETCGSNYGGAIRFVSSTLQYCDGSSTWQTISSGATGTAISSLTAATTTNTINNQAYQQNWNWNSLAGGTGLALGSSSLTSGNILSVTNSNAAATGSNINVTSNATSGYGIYASNTATTGGTVGVYGTVASTNSAAAGVQGVNTSATGSGSGVYGLNTTSTNSGAVGVYGSDFATGNSGAGVYGYDVSPTGYALEGYGGMLLNGPAQTLASSATANYAMAQIYPPTLTFTGGTHITGLISSIWFASQTLTDATAATADYAANTVIYGAPILASSSNSLSLGTTYGLDIASVNVGAATNSYGMSVNAMTGATNNYAAIFNGGYVGIGTNNPTAALTVVGNINYTGTITATSDIRLKKDITPLDAQTIMARLAQVKTYSFRYKTDPEGRLQYGVIAQEIEKTFPELVVTANDNMHTKSVNYIGLIAPLVDATQTLKSDNDNLRTQVAQLKASQTNTVQTLAQMQKDINGMKAHTGYGIDHADLLGGVGGLVAPGAIAVAGFAGGIAFRGRKRRKKGGAE